MARQRDRAVQAKLIAGATTSQNGTVAPSRTSPRAAGTSASVHKPAASHATSTEANGAASRDDDVSLGGGTRKDLRAAAVLRRTGVSGTVSGESSIVDSDSRKNCGDGWTRRELPKATTPIPDGSQPQGETSLRRPDLRVCDRREQRRTPRLCMR